jgi:hypothetical protein
MAERRVILSAKFPRRGSLFIKAAWQLLLNAASPVQPLKAAAKSPICLTYLNTP